MKRLKLLTAVVLTACCVSTYAVENGEHPSRNSELHAGEVDLPNDNASGIDGTSSVKLRKKHKISGTEKVKKEIDAYFSERGIIEGQPDKDGNIYFRGVAKVTRDVRDPYFISARSLAFEKACQDAVAKYVLDRFGKEELESERKYFQDNSSGRLSSRAMAKDARSRIAEKAEMLAEAELDSRLRELGRNPQGSIVEKRNLLTDSIIKRSTQIAFGTAAGLLPVQSFEGYTEAGKYAVGVVLRGGVATEEIAACLRDKKLPRIFRKTGIAPMDAVPKGEELVAQFGVRLIFDEDGVPTLLSFGQWGISYQGSDDDMMDRAEESACRQAKRVADEALTQFINNTISVKDTSERGEGKAVTNLLDSNGNISEETIIDLIDKIERTSNLRGSDSLIGRTTLVSPRIIDHPSGHQVAICVRMWSFKQYEAMTRKVEGNVKDSASPQLDNESFGESGSGVRRGKSFDF